MHTVQQILIWSEEEEESEVSGPLIFFQGVWDTKEPHYFTAFLIVKSILFKILLSAWPCPLATRQAYFYFIISILLCRFTYTRRFAFHWRPDAKRITWQINGRLFAVWKFGMVVCAVKFKIASQFQIDITHGRGCRPES